MTPARSDEKATVKTTAMPADTSHTDAALRGGPVTPARARLQALGMDEITVTGGFWGDIQELNAHAIIGHCLEWMEKIGWLGNFDRAADGTIGDAHAGIEFVDSEVYKLLEAMAWELGRSHDDALAEQYGALVSRVGAAQEPDGYLNTSFGRPGQRARFSDLEWGHEMYCLGHLLQAAVARLRTGYDDELPAIARRAADFLYAQFGPNGRAAIDGHPEVEMALAEFGRATGAARFVQLASLMVERRGTGKLAPIEYGAEYFQDDAPVRHASAMRGHAVRALYLAAGAFDVAVETNDNELAGAVRGQYASMLARRTYLTGGVGAHHRDEAFGSDFELPPDRAYSETCAGIASAMLSWRLLLDGGEAKFGDVIERTLLNSVLVSPRADGRAFYYTNTLHQRVAGTEPSEGAPSVRAQSSLRAPWFEVSCCPTNVARTLASAALYFATKDDAGVQLHQYGTYRIDTTVAGDRVAIAVETAYPLDGRVTVTVETAPVGPLRIALRIPAWSAGLATCAASSAGAAVRFEDGYAYVEGEFNDGDVITLTLPMEPRFTYPPYEVDAVRGQVAVERGPLVLALESVDLPGGADTEHIAVDVTAGVSATEGGASVTLRRAAASADGAWPYSSEQAQRAFGERSRLAWCPTTRGRTAGRRRCASSCRSRGSRRR